VVLNAARHIGVRGYRGLVLRRLSKQLVGGGSMMDKMVEVYPFIGGEPINKDPPFWRFKPDARIETGHLQYDKDVYSFQGRDFPYIGMDEAQQFTDNQIWYMRSRMRSMTGLDAKLDLPCNPDPDCLIRRLIDWWIDPNGYPIWERSGMLRYFYRVNEALDWDNDPDELRHRHRNHDVSEDPPTSITFIPGRLEDNKLLLEADPTYKARLRELTYVERMRLLEGNWNVRPAAGQYFQRHWFEMVETVNPSKIKNEVRAWDFAATAPTSDNPDPDWTRGVKLARLTDDKIVVRHVTSLRAGPAEVERALINTAAQDGRDCAIALWQDPGQAGKAQADYLERQLAGYRAVSEVASKDKVTYAGPASSAAEKGSILVEIGDWNDEFFNEVESFPEGAHDDIVDALSRAYRYLTHGMVLVPKPVTGGRMQSASLMGGKRKGMWRR
jgi:predicted phage terminase large subunit-like protein